MSEKPQKICRGRKVVNPLDGEVKFLCTCRDCKRIHKSDVGKLDPNIIQSSSILESKVISESSKTGSKTGIDLESTLNSVDAKSKSHTDDLQSKSAIESETGIKFKPDEEDDKSKSQNEQLNKSKTSIQSQSSMKSNLDGTSKSKSNEEKSHEENINSKLSTSDSKTEKLQVTSKTDSISSEKNQTKSLNNIEQDENKEFKSEDKFADDSEKPCPTLDVCFGQEKSLKHSNDPCKAPCSKISVLKKEPSEIKYTEQDTSRKLIENNVSTKAIPTEAHLPNIDEENLTSKFSISSSKNADSQVKTDSIKSDKSHAKSEEKIENDANEENYNTKEIEKNGVEESVESKVGAVSKSGELSVKSKTDSIRSNESQSKSSEKSEEYVDEKPCPILRVCIGQEKPLKHSKIPCNAPCSKISIFKKKSSKKNYVDIDISKTSTKNKDSVEIVATENIIPKTDQKIITPNLNNVSSKSGESEIKHKTDSIISDKNQSEEVNTTDDNIVSSKSGESEVKHKTDSIISDKNQTEEVNTTDDNIVSSKSGESEVKHKTDSIISDKNQSEEVNTTDYNIVSSKSGESEVKYKTDSIISDKSQIKEDNRTDNNINGKACPTLPICFGQEKPLKSYKNLCKAPCSKVSVVKNEASKTRSIPKDVSKISTNDKLPVEQLPAEDNLQSMEKERDKADEILEASKQSIQEVFGNEDDILKSKDNIDITQKEIMPTSKKSKVNSIPEDVTSKHSTDKLENMDNLFKETKESIGTFSKETPNSTNTGIINNSKIKNGTCPILPTCEREKNRKPCPAPCGKKEKKEAIKTDLKSSIQSTRTGSKVAGLKPLTDAKDIKANPKALVSKSGVVKAGKKKT